MTMKRRRTANAAVLFLASALVCMECMRVDAVCPNRCGGPARGRCGMHDRCICKRGYMGIDCSKRTCSFARAWSDTPFAKNQAHAYAECAGVGVCDRETGLCQCSPGFSGEGCLSKIEEPKSEDPVDQCNYIDAYMRCFKEECCKEKKLLDAIETLTKFATDQDLPCTTITCGAAAALQANLILTAAAILFLTLFSA